jgi:hypothetical protein
VLTDRNGWFTITIINPWAATWLAEQHGDNTPRIR